MTDDIDQEQDTEDSTDSPESSPTGIHKGRQVKKADDKAMPALSGAIISQRGKVTPLKERTSQVISVSPLKLFGDQKNKSDKPINEGLKILVKDADQK